MYIESKNGYFYLVKKVFGKKLSVYLGKENSINLEAVNKISKIECDNIFGSKSFVDFDKLQYGLSNLSKIVYETIDIINTAEFDNSKKNKLQNKKLIFPIDFIYESNRTEGSKIPSRIVGQIIQGKKFKYKVNNEILEVKNSSKAYEFLIKDFVFNESNIKRLYHILIKDLLQENGTKYPRGFKKIMSVVNNNETTKPENVKKEIKELLLSYREKKKYIFSLQLAFDFHLKFEQIHPFENGNGRIGRLLMNKILISAGYLPMIIYSGNSKSYFNAISSASEGNKKKYYKFMLDQYRMTLAKFWLK